MTEIDKRGRLKFISLMMVALLSSPWVVFAGETGMSYDETGGPGQAPHIAPPGGGNPPPPLTTNTTPVTGVEPLQEGVPQREVQPGEETPQVDVQTPTVGGMRPPISGLTKDGGQGGSDPGGSDGGGKGSGGSGGSGGGGKSDPPPSHLDLLESLDSGSDGDLLDELSVERRTVRGVDTPLSTNQGLENAPGDPQSGQAAPPQNPMANQGTGSGGGPLPSKGSSLPDMPTPAGNSNQPGIDLFPDKNPGGSPLKGLGKTPPTSAPPATGKNPMIRPGRPPVQKGPGAVVIERTNCGTFHTGWVDDPEADVNPCPKACERGERLWVEAQKSGDKTQYDGTYRCYLPELVFNQKPEIARQIEAGGVTGTNCGTFWADKQDDPNADVNPCPSNCEQGELLDVRRDLSYDGSQTIYQKNYRCYQAGTMKLTPELKGNTPPPPRDLPSSPNRTGTDRPEPGLDGKNLEKPRATGTLNLKVEPSEYEPSTAKVTWDYDGNPQGATFDLYVATTAEDQWLLYAGDVSNGSWERAGYYSRPLDATKTYRFALVQNNPDGTILRGETGAFQPIPPHVPQKVTAIQVGDSDVVVVWPKVWEYLHKAEGCKDARKCPDVEQLYYEVYGDTTSLRKYEKAQETRGVTAEILSVLPPGFVESPDPKDYRWVGFKNLAHGTYHFSVGAVYENGERVPVDQWPSAAVTVTEFTNTYRVSVHGIEVHQATLDDPLERDGKGDEIYVMARVNGFYTDTRTRGKYNQTSFIYFPVFGDINGFSDRTQAGTASSQGGIRSGDYLGLRPMETGTPSSRNFPYLLWEGPLRELWDYVLITPSVWEWDANDIAAPPDKIFRELGLPGELRGAEGFGFGQYYLADGGVCHLVNDNPDEQNDDQWNRTFARAIGMKRSASGVMVGPECRTLFLTRPKIETALRALPSQVVSLDLQDAKSGHYTMYVKIERLP